MRTELAAHKNRWRIPFPGPLALILGVTLLLFARTVSFQFVPWDDDVNIYHNEGVKHFAIYSIRHFWRAPYEHFYTPLLYTVWSAVAAISPHAAPGALGAPFGPAPFLFHALNVLMHLANVAIVFFWTRALLRARFPDLVAKPDSDWAIALGTACFAWHPVQAESVAWVSGFRDIFYTFLGLLALNAFTRFGQTGSWRSYAAATLGFALALFAKASAAMLPGAAVVVGLYLGTPRRRLTGTLPWFAASLAYAMVTSRIQVRDVAETGPPLSARIFIALDSLTHAAGNFLLPIFNSNNYARTPESIFSAGWFPLTALLPLAIGASIYRLHGETRRVTALAFGLAFAALLPTSGIVSFVSQNVSTVFDRYLYFPLVGAALLVAWMLLTRPRRVTFVVAGLALTFWAMRTWTQAGYWADAVTLFHHEIDVGPRRISGYQNLALYYENERQFESARYYFGLARSLAPDNKWIHNHLEQLRPENIEINDWLNAGIEASQGRRYAEAEKLFRRVLARKPNHAGTLNNLGNLFALQDRYADAIQYFQLALLQNPNSVPTMTGLARAQRHQGDIGGARATLERALVLEPQSVIVQAMLADLTANDRKVSSDATPPK